MQPAAADDVVIITCALTGGIHGKEANPRLPEQPDEIVEQGIAAWRAGAAVLHVHARKPDGSSTMDPAIFRVLHERLCAATDAVVQLTTGGSPRLPVAERVRTVHLAPEMASLNMGLLNFFIGGEQVFFANHRSDIEAFAREMAARQVRPEFEVYSAAMLDELAHLLSLGIFAPPYAVNFVLHTPTQGGSRGTARNLVDMVERLADLPVSRQDLRVTVSSMGRTQLPLTTTAIAMGLNARVGLEDNVYFRRGELAESNAQLVERTVRIARALERHDPCPWRKPFPTGEDEVTGHGAGGNDDVESPVGVLLDEPAGRAPRIFPVSAKPDDVEILDKDFVAHPLRLGQPCPEPLHELHEHGARGPLLIDDEDPLDRHRLRRGLLRRRIGCSGRRDNERSKRAWDRGQQKPPASRHGHDGFPELASRYCTPSRNGRSDDRVR